ncbi:cx9C motif-containing protein 4-like isoform X2 [Portunus trituberculatus]|uniref:cx9C motif-containing protein 4-like isoform X2 n=1 Tax=Portunus trituberculatus TaxID=210409 RepID=UPI001E1CB0EC|nr:cx9C motif-containing protein 4-like isoform X2 [Portunus trituberculatus]
MKKDPCQRQACAIQECLQKNKYQEAACEAQIAALEECCKKWYKESGCCAGVKIKDSTTNTAALKTTFSDQKSNV